MIPDIETGRSRQHLFEPFLDLVERHQQFLISGHVNPDGDCIGTQVALYHFLVAAKKDVRILNTHPPEPALDFLAERTPFGVHCQGEPLPPHEVHILTDCSTLDRLGSVGAAARSCEGVTYVVCDHHVGSDRGDGDVLLWDVTACASGAVVYDLFRKAGAPVGFAAAEGMFVSIVSDTGWFQYSNTDDGCLAIAADLVAHDVQPHKIYNALFRRKPPSSIDLLATGLGYTYFEADGRIAVCPLPLRFMSRVEQHAFNTDDLLDPMRSVAGVDVVLLLKQRPGNKVKISLRASDRVDVDGVARTFGGGGHHKASGAELPGSLADVTAQVLGKLHELLGGAA